MDILLRGEPTDEVNGRPNESCSEVTEEGEIRAMRGTASQAELGIEGAGQVEGGVKIELHLLNVVVDNFRYSDDGSPNLPLMRLLKHAHPESVSTISLVGISGGLSLRKHKNAYFVSLVAHYDVWLVGVPVRVEHISIESLILI